MKQWLPGFSLIELLLSIFISTLIAGALVVIFRTFYTNLTQNQSQLDQQAKSANALERVSKHLRQTQTIESAQNQDLIFYAYYYPSDPTPDRLQVQISNNNLILGVIRPSGTAPNFTYPLANETTQIVAINIANGANPLFKYYDLNGNLLSSPLNPAAIKMIEVNLWIGAGQGITIPAPLLLSTKVNLRNLKNNL